MLIKSSKENLHLGKFDVRKYLQPTKLKQTRPLLAKLSLTALCDTELIRNGTF